MAKKDKKKAADKKVRAAQKQEKKTAKGEKKQKTKGAKEDDSDAEDVDLDAVLAEYAKQQEQFLKITETVCQPPSPRGSATFVGSPVRSNELFLFGGEYFNGALASFYNQLFIYNINRDEWRLVTSPNSPLPRSGHAWTRAGNIQDIFLFGGEFSSPKQGTFYHYNDFWKLDPASREWTRIETKGKGPPARSGHRMTYFKNYVILFGGFQDTSQQTKYLSDLWLYDCQTFTWHNPALPPASPKPDARSSFSFLPHDSGAVLYGGYSRVKASASTSQKSKGGATRTILKPVIHQDTFFLRITPPSPEASANTPPKVIWERRKRPANPPNPTRAGVTMAHHKGRGIMFGGVHDVEESEEGIDSEFFDQLQERVQRKLLVVQPRGVDENEGKADEEELLKNLAALETRGKVTSDMDEGGSSSTNVPKADEDEAPERPEKPVIFVMPHPRFNAPLTVQDDVLYIFGGTFEKADREFTFDELWAIDLGKLDGVKEIFKRELEDWQGSEDDEGSEDEEEDDDVEDSEDDAEDGEMSETASTAATSVSNTPMSPTKGLEADSVQENGDTGFAEEVSSSLEDALPHPRPFESLRDFYARTSVQWQEAIVAELSTASATGGKTVKEVRKSAFGRAEEKWWDCREEVRNLEDEQLEAGIGEVVSLADKGGEAGGGGPGRRR